MNNLFGIIFAFACVLLPFRNYAQHRIERPFAIFGDNTPVVELDVHKHSNLSVIILMPDSTFAHMEISDSIMNIRDANGVLLFSQTVVPSVRAIFTTVDPKADEMPNISPYVYCMGNPIRFIDKDGQRPTEYEAALMASAVYDTQKKDFNSSKVMENLQNLGWTISTFNTSIKMNNTKLYEDGLQSALFEKTTDGKTEYAYVYAGTNSFEDILEDVAQLVGQAPQYRSAIKNAETLSKEVGSAELTFIGHSLGGGEAAAASMATGRAAITFNPAAVSPLTKFFNDLGKASNVTNYRTVPSGNGIIKFGGCFVNNFQNNIGMRAPGKTINVPIDGHNPYSAHRIINFVEFFKKKQ